MASCDGTAAPVLVAPAERNWSRCEVLDWLLARRDEAMLVGFDFSFSAPFVQRRAHLPGETASTTGPELWAHVDRHSDDPDLGAASFLEQRRGRHFYLGAADGRKADFLHYRRCETMTGTTKPSSVYDAIGAAQVAKASFAGMRLLHRLHGRVPIWPFDPAPDRGMLVVEIYTAIAARAAGLRAGRSKLRTGEALDAALTVLGSAPFHSTEWLSDHQTDAVLASAWLRATAGRADLWHPPAMADVAASEGWTFGVA